MVGATIASFAMAATATAISGINAYQSNKAKAKATLQQAEGEIAANNIQAAQVQAQAEQDRAKRSRQLAADISNAYAQYAGNGLAVDAGGTETIGAVVQGNRNEAQADINTINENAKNNLWSITQSSKNIRSSANSQIKAYRHQSKLGAWQAISGLPLVDSTGFSMAANTTGNMANNYAAQKKTPNNNLGWGNVGNESTPSGVASYYRN